MLYAQMATLEAGDTLDHYRLEGIVAHSGMSTLYRATDLRDGKKVALKIPHAEMEADLGLPHALGTALAAAVKKQNHRPFSAVVAAPVLRQVDLEAVGDAMQFDAAIEEARFLWRSGVTLAQGSDCRGGQQGPCKGEEKGGQSERTKHDGI